MRWQRAGRPIRVVFANSIQAGNGTPYGVGKERAAHVLASAAGTAGGHFVDVLLPNLFGEHGRPAYNSFVATFVDTAGSRWSARGAGPRGRPPARARRGPVAHRRPDHRRVDPGAARHAQHRGGRPRHAPGVRRAVPQRRSARPGHPVARRPVQHLPGGALPRALSHRLDDALGRPWPTRRDGARPWRSGADVRLDDQAGHHPRGALPSGQGRTVRRAGGPGADLAAPGIPLADRVVRRLGGGSRGHRHADHVGPQHHQHRRRPRSPRCSGPTPSSTRTAPTRTRNLWAMS